jgi:hypothetical protein
VVPFLPFSISEAAVLAHSFLLRISDNIRRPVNEKTLHLGRVKLSIRNDGLLCEHIAKCSYDKSTGARPIKNNVEIEVAEHITSTYQNDDEIDARESNENPFRLYELDLHCLKNKECGQGCITLHDVH